MYRWRTVGLPAGLELERELAPVPSRVHDAVEIRIVLDGDVDDLRREGRPDLGEERECLFGGESVTDDVRRHLPQQGREEGDDGYSSLEHGL